MRLLRPFIWHSRLFQILFGPELAQMQAQAVVTAETNIKMEILTSIAEKQNKAAAENITQLAIDEANQKKAGKIVDFDPTAIDTPPPGTAVGDACQTGLRKRFSKQYSA